MRSLPRDLEPASTFVLSLTCVPFLLASGCSWEARLPPMGPKWPSDPEPLLTDRVFSEASGPPQFSFQSPE